LTCLREDLELAVPHADILVEEISHPLLARAIRERRCSALDKDVEHPD